MELTDRGEALAGGIPEFQRDVVTDTVDHLLGEGLECLKANVVGTLRGVAVVGRVLEIEGEGGRQRYLLGFTQDQIDGQFHRISFGSAPNRTIVVVQVSNFHPLAEINVAEALSAKVHAVVGTSIGAIAPLKVAAITGMVDRDLHPVGAAGILELSGSLTADLVQNGAEKAIGIFTVGEAIQVQTHGFGVNNLVGLHIKRRDVVDLPVITIHAVKNL